MALVLDRREMSLADALRHSVQFETKDLPVADILCTYSNGSSWVAERKTVKDLAASVRQGRWAEQCSRMHGTGCSSIFFVIEGDLREESLGMPYNALWSACLNAELRKSSHLIRTWDVAETATVVRLLVQKGDAPAAIPTGIAPPVMLGKRRGRAAIAHTYMQRSAF
jgi:ERCC4-type nuclease